MNFFEIFGNSVCVFLTSIGKVFASLIFIGLGVHNVRIFMTYQILIMSNVSIIANIPYSETVIIIMPVTDFLKTFSK